jgi:hypothetical protein
MCMSQTCLYDHVLGTDIHVSETVAYFLRIQSKVRNFTKKKYIYILSLVGGYA